MKRLLIALVSAAAILAVVLELTLLFGGYQILASSKVEAFDEPVAIEGFAGQYNNILMCKYFDGRAMRLSTRPNTDDGCTFFHRPGKANVNIIVTSKSGLK